MTKIDDARIAVRPTVAGDVPGLRAVVDGTELFPGEMLPDMVAGFLGDAPSDLWLTATLDGEPMGLCFARPEELAEGTWNMLALGVAPAHQGGGLGARILIVDTSGTDGFTLARAFYAKQGYEPEARIHDYWADGDDKVTFRKRLG